MKKFKSKLQFLHLDFKREILKIIAIPVALISVGTVVSILLKSFLYVGFGIGFGAISVVLLIASYDTRIETINRDNLEDFVNLFSFFRIYIKNGFNVYGALKEITFFANPQLKEMLDKLIEDIDEDKSVQPFIKFARNFDEIIVEEMMISIYQMIDDGEQSNYLNQFEMIFDKFSDLLVEKNLKKKDSSLGSLSSAPLIGSCFLIIMITMGIIGIMGDLMNVL